MKKNKPTGAQVVAKAKSYIGKYAKHCNRFIKYYAGHWGIPKSGRIEAGWCTIFAGYVLDHVGAGDQLPKKQLRKLGKKWWNTQHLWAWFKAHGKTTTDPAKAKMGALAFKKVGSTKKKTTGHTSIFWKYENGYVYTIDGNVGGGVKVRRKKPEWYVGFVNLNYSSKTTKQNKKD